MLRRFDFRTANEAATMRARVWALRVFVDDPIELRFDNADDFDLEPGDLVSDDYGPCQAFASRIRKTRGSAALIVPSAALPGTKNLVLFGVRVRLEYNLEPLGLVDVPLSIAADDALALSSVRSNVRFHGQQHAEFEAWKSGVPYEFREPSTDMALR